MRESHQKEPSSGVAVDQTETPVARQWQQWRQQHCPDFDAFACAGRALSPDQVLAVLRCDQHERWRHGERMPAETYVQKYRLLREDPDAGLLLVYSEFALRQELGETATLEEYLERFPQHAEGLRQQYELDRALAAAAPGSPTMRAPPSLLAAQIAELPAQGAARSSWPAIPGYEILGELGRGGMGVVYQARQAGLNRLVALKMLRLGEDASPDQLARFAREAEAVAQLQHSHIVQIHEVGCQDGRPYFALEYMDGGSLDKKLAGQPQAARLAAQLVETLARAMHMAHQHHIVHRDLKPANVLLSGGADTPLEQCIPKITDFGLAKRLDVDLGQTQSGVVMGTPPYMAPEQARGHSKEVGPAADVYALGAILYELLTGRPPFQGENALDTLQQVVSQDPVAPRFLQPKVPRDLETICLRCLHKEAGKRYASAEALAEDLERFLAGEPIRARPVGSAERFWRWCRRNPLAASLAGALGLIVIGSLMGLTGLYLNADSQRRRAEGAEESLQKAADEAREGEKKARQSEAQTKTVLEFFQKRVMAAARPKGQQGGLGGDATIRAAVEQAEPGIAEAFAEQPLVEASIRQVLGHTYWFWGEYPQAIRQQQRAVALRRDHLGPDHPETLKSMASLAQAYQEAGQQAEALQLYQEALKLREARSGPNDPETLWSMKGVADALVSAGRLEEALPLYEEALRRANAALERDHADTLLYMDKLGDAYRRAGRLAEAVPLLEAALRRARAKSAWGPNHPSTLVIMNNLAIAYNAAGRFEEAVAQLRETIARMEAVFGPEHREILNALTNLGVMYREAGQLDEALPLLEEALKGKTANQGLGPDHFLTLMSMGELATAYQKAGRPTEALPLFEKTLRLQKVKRGADDPWRLTFLSRTGACLIQMKKFGEAEAYLRECLALRTPKHPERGRFSTPRANSVRR
jgi:serine/threonine-protein kinase